MRSLTLRRLLVALRQLGLEALTQQRSQLGIAEFIDAGPVVGGLDNLARLAFEAICDLLERPALAILQGAVDERLGQRIDLLAVWIFRIDPVDLKPQRIGENFGAGIAGLAIAFTMFAHLKPV